MKAIGLGSSASAAAPAGLASCRLDRPPGLGLGRSRRRRLLRRLAWTRIKEKVQQSDVDGEKVQEEAPAGSDEREDVDKSEETEVESEDETDEKKKCNELDFVYDVGLEETETRDKLQVRKLRKKCVQKIDEAIETWQRLFRVPAEARDVYVERFGDIIQFKADEDGDSGSDSGDGTYDAEESESEGDYSGGTGSEESEEEDTREDSDGYYEEERSTGPRARRTPSRPGATGAPEAGVPCIGSSHWAPRGPSGPAAASGGAANATNARD